MVPPAPKRPPPKLPVAEEDDITKQLADFQKKVDAYIKENSEGSGGAATASAEEPKTGGAPTKTAREKLQEEWTISGQHEFACIKLGAILKNNSDIEKSSGFRSTSIVAAAYEHSENVLPFPGL